jgi:hypothetical protein
MELGALGSLNYRMGFPQQQAPGQQPIPPQQQGGGQYQVPVEKDPLATRGKLTSDYYNNVGLLRSFLQEHGSDAAKPDYTQEGGGMAHQVFQQLQANVMMSANALKNEQAAENQMRPSIAEGRTRIKGGVDQSGMYATDAQNYTPTAIDPLVLEANKELGDPRYTQANSDELNRAVRDPKIQYYQQQIQKDPANAEYYNRQIEALLQNTPQVYAPAAFDRDRGTGKFDYQTGLLRKYTNLKNGVWSPDSYTKTISRGKVYLKNEESKGDVMGKYNAGTDSNGNIVYKDKIVDSWLKDPSTGKVYIKYTDSTIPMEEVSNQPGDAVTRTFVSNNSKYGSVDKIMEAATATGLTNEQGSSVDPMLMPQNFQDIQSQVRQSGNQAASKIQGVVSTLKKQLSELEDPMLGNNWVAYTLPDGRKVQVAKHRNKKTYYIKNYEELGFSGDEPKNLTEDDVISYLSDDFGYLNQYLEEPDTPSQPTTQVDNRAAQIKAKYGIR